MISETDFDGRLRPAVEAYLAGEDLSEDQIATLRAYLRQWIMADCWDANPHAQAEQRVWLMEMRARIEMLTTRARIVEWLAEAISQGMDPL